MLFGGLVKRRVVITGLGLITPLAIGTKETWEALCAGRSGVAEITRFDTSALPTRIAAEVKDFHPEDFLNKKDTKRFRRFVAYAIAASRMALEDSGLKIDESNPNNYFNRAILKEQMENFGGAAQDYTKVIELNPEDANAYFNRGSCYARGDNFVNAIN